MSDQPIAHLIEQLLYPIDQAPSLTDDAVVDHFAATLIEGRLFIPAVESFGPAIDSVVAADRLPAPAGRYSELYSEQQILAFLRLLATKLAARAPWPPRAFVKVPTTAHWPEFARAEPIARLHQPLLTLEGLLGTLDAVPSAAGTPFVIVLDLRTGERVAVAGPAGPGHRWFELFPLGAADPAGVVAHFAELTGAAVEAVVREGS
jgi:hypothetical protein